MKFEKDFRENEMELEKESQDWLLREDTRNTEAAVQGIMDIAEAYQSQYVKIFSPEKLNKVKHAYRKLSEVALHSSGYVSLEINETEKEAVLIHRSRFLFASNFDDEGADLVADTLSNIFASFRLITLSAKQEEVVIEIREKLYKEWLAVDKSDEIKEMKDSLRKKGH